MEGEGVPVEFLRASRCDILAGAEYRVALGYLEHLVQLVRDEEYRDAAGLEFLDHGEEGLHFLLG